MDPTEEWTTDRVLEFCFNILSNSNVVIPMLRQGYRNIDKFISKTIPAFAENNILAEGGVIYLPFQISFFSQIVAKIETLKNYYSVAFIGCTGKNTLWSCTQNISEVEMQQVFEKTKDQEELYCKVTEREIKQNYSLNVCGDELLHIFNRIDNPTTTRFIQLTHLAKGDCRLGFTGLGKDIRRITKRHVSKAKSKADVPIVHNKRQCFIPASTLRHIERYIECKWPRGNDTKNDFCIGMRRLLHSESNSQTTTVAVAVGSEQPKPDDISTILDLVKQRYPDRFEKVKKALIEKD